MCLCDRRNESRVRSSRLRRSGCQKAQKRRLGDLSPSPSTSTSTSTKKAEARASELSRSAGHFRPSPPRGRRVGDEGAKNENKQRGATHLELFA
ncbi:MAG: hypothetical protein RLZZ232_3722 [Planctomycetota bacterium]